MTDYLLACCSMVFSMAGLYFFIKTSQVLKETQERIEKYFQSADMFLDALRDSVDK